MNEHETYQVECAMVSDTEARASERISVHSIAELGVTLLPDDLIGQFDHPAHLQSSLTLFVDVDANNSVAIILDLDSLVSPNSETLIRLSLSDHGIGG